MRPIQADIKRGVADGDIIDVMWEGDPVSYLCRVNEMNNGEFTLNSVDRSFKGVLAFDQDMDVWIFAKGNRKAKPKKKKNRVIGEDPELLRRRTLAAASADSKKALEGLFFVITGVTEELDGEDFKAHVSALIESAGGVTRTAISGKTDYLVAGTIHYNPWLGTRGPIESGSKYQKALTSDKCTIIDLEQLEELINSADAV